MSKEIKVGDKVKCIDVSKYENSLTVGKIYTITDVSESMVYFSDDRQTIRGANPRRFEHVNSIPSMEEQIKLAKSYVGKEVIIDSNGIKITVDKAIVRIDDSDRYNISGLVREFYDEYGYSVYIQSLGEFPHKVPVTQVTLAPEFKELKLNDNYTAKIYKDKVEVGCQTFPIEVVKELVKMVN